MKKDSDDVIAESFLIGDYPGTPNSDPSKTYPLTVDYDEKRWSINLTKQKFSMPFRVQLEKFTKVEHPGTDKPMEYKSKVTKLDTGGAPETSLIEMNRPLRAEGFTVYQASFGPPEP